MRRLRLSRRAVCQILLQLRQYPTAETGGVFIGYKREDSFYVIEAVDAGPGARCSSAECCFDREYVRHCVFLLSELYSPRPELIGVWHKHNHSLSADFSGEDMAINRQAAEIAGGTAVSLLLKKEKEGLYLPAAFSVEADGKLTELELDAADDFPVAYSMF